MRHMITVCGVERSIDDPTQPTDRPSVHMIKASLSIRASWKVNFTAGDNNHKEIVYNFPLICYSLFLDGSSISDKYSRLTGRVSNAQQRKRRRDALAAECN